MPEHLKRHVIQADVFFLVPGFFLFVGEGALIVWDLFRREGGPDALQTFGSVGLLLVCAGLGLALAGALTLRSNYSSLRLRSTQTFGRAGLERDDGLPARRLLLTWVREWVCFACLYHGHAAESRVVGSLSERCQFRSIGPRRSPMLGSGLPEPSSHQITLVDAARRVAPLAARSLKGAACEGRAIACAALSVGFGAS